LILSPMKGRASGPSGRSSGWYTSLASRGSAWMPDRSAEAMLATRVGVDPAYLDRLIDLGIIRGGDSQW